MFDMPYFGFSNTSHEPFPEKQVVEYKYCQSCGCPFLRSIHKEIEIDDVSGFQRIRIIGPVDCRRCTEARQMAETRAVSRDLLIVKDMREKEVKRFRKRGAQPADKDSPTRHIRKIHYQEWLPILVAKFKEVKLNGLTAAEIAEIVSPNSHMSSARVMWSLRHRHGLVFVSIGSVKGKRGMVRKYDLLWQ